MLSCVGLELPFKGHSFDWRADGAAIGGGAGDVMREIVDGKLGAFIDGAGFLFNTIEFWKNVVALGGPESAEVSDADREKGDPETSWEHSVQAVPMKVHNVTIIDLNRKA